MPTNHTPLSALSARLLWLAVDAQVAADALLAEPMSDVEAEFYLAPAASALAIVLDDLDDAFYRAEKLDQSHRSRDLAIARTIANAPAGLDQLAA